MTVACVHIMSGLRCDHRAGPRRDPLREANSIRADALGPLRRAACGARCVERDRMGRTDPLRRTEHREARAHAQLGIVVHRLRAARARVDLHRAERAGLTAPIEVALHVRLQRALPKRDRDEQSRDLLPRRVVLAYGWASTMVAIAVASAV